MTATPDVLYEDNHCLAVNKPAPPADAGLPPGVPSLEALARAYLKEKYNKPGNVYLGIPHRLDRPVSGVVVFARNTKAAQRLAEQFRERQVTKIYWALVEGRVEPAEGDVGRLAAQDAGGSADGESRRPTRRGPSWPRCTIAFCSGVRAAPAGDSSRRPAACTRSACRRRCAAGPSSAMSLYGSTRALRPAGGVAARPGHRPARPQPDVSAPDPLRADHADGAAAGVLGCPAVRGPVLRTCGRPRSDGRAGRPRRRRPACGIPAHHQPVDDIL